jgi:hypothetical protein
MAYLCMPGGYFRGCLGRGKAKGPEPRTVGGCGNSGPMIEAGAPSTEEATLLHREGTRPTGDSHDRITDDRAQRGEGAKEGRAKGRSKSAAEASIMAGASQSPGRGS